MTQEEITKAIENYIETTLFGCMPHMSQAHSSYLFNIWRDINAKGLADATEQKLINIKGF